MNDRKEFQCLNWLHLFFLRPIATKGQLADYYKQETGKVLTTDAVRKNYLEELENNGYIDKEDSELDKRLKIYWPIVDFKIPTAEEEKIKKCARSAVTQIRNRMERQAEKWYFELRESRYRYKSMPQIESRY